MNDHNILATPPPAAAPTTEADGNSNTITPLPGEPGIPNVATSQPFTWSIKGLLAVALLMLGLVGLSAFSIQRYAASGQDDDDEDSKLQRDRPSAASAGTRRLDMAMPPAPRVPALLPEADVAEPISVRRAGQPAPAAGPKGLSPEDAPVLVVSSRPGAYPSGGEASTQRQGATGTQVVGTTNESFDPDDPMAATTRNLQGYQRQLQGLLDNLTQSSAIATSPTSGTASPGAPQGGPTTTGMAPAPAGLFGGQLQGSATPKVAATQLGDRSLTLPKGTAFTCALKTKVISATSGLVGCQVQRNVYGDNGRVLLIERGSHLDGEYRVTSVRPGTVRIPVLWTRIRTPLGVTVDIDSPGTGQLGESGIDGHVDNRWGERIGAAMLLSLIDDSVKLLIQNQAQDQQANTIVLPSTTDNTSKLAEKVLDSTINIPPLIYQNQGGIVGIYVARDVDFSSVYELQPVAR
jgi:type IV secretion system protein VirB10